MGNFRQQSTIWLFVTYSRQCKGEPISKQRLSNWLVECIKYSHSKKINSPPQWELKVTTPAWLSHMLTWRELPPVHQQCHSMVKL